MGRCLLAATVALPMLLALGARAAYSHGDHDHHEKGALKRSVKTFSVPRVALVRGDAATVDFSAELQDSRPVYLNFIYTSCTTVCPVMSQVLAQLQEALGKDRDKVLMMSVSIDPEFDTPERLGAYARQFEAGPQWRFYTGTLDASIAVQRAFGVYTRDKMGHPVATFYRPAPERPWVRIDGFATPADLEREYRSEAAEH
jgi:protein SCO1/2